MCRPLPSRTHPQRERAHTHISIKARHSGSTTTICDGIMHGRSIQLDRATYQTPGWMTDEPQIKNYDPPPSSSTSRSASADITEFHGWKVPCSGEVGRRWKTDTAETFIMRNLLFIKMHWFTIMVNLHDLLLQAQLERIRLCLLMGWKRPTSIKRLCRLLINGLYLKYKYIRSCWQWAFSFLKHFFFLFFFNFLYSFFLNISSLLK